MTTVTLNIHPPEECSPNWRGHWAVKSRASRAAREAVKLSAHQADGGPYHKAHIHYHVICAAERPRDIDNWLARCKPMTDGLRDAGIIGADDHKHLSLSMTFEVNKNRAPSTVITVTEMN